MRILQSLQADRADPQGSLHLVVHHRRGRSIPQYQASLVLLGVALPSQTHMETWILLQVCSIILSLLLFVSFNPRHLDASLKWWHHYIYDIAVSSFQENSLCPIKVSANQENDPGVRVFAMGEIIRATNNFSPSMKIGQGGFGTVYKGKLRNGDWVAIKRAKKVKPA